MEDIVFATNNPNKLKEVREIIGNKFNILSLSDIGCFDEIPETGNTFYENALLKAKHVKINYGYDCFSEDSGLCVDWLKGAPGVYSARYARESENDTLDDQKNIDKLLKNLIDVDYFRQAHFVATIVLIKDNGIYSFQELINGEITKEQKGLNGFGYDSVFIPDGYVITFGEFSEEAKNVISHRGKAINSLTNFLIK